MDTLKLDLRYALRAIRRAPLFSTVAILCLGAGIGVNAAAFSVLDAFMLRDLPGVERQREINTVLVTRRTAWGMSSPSHLTTLDWRVMRDAVSGFEHIAVFGTASLPLPSGGQPVAARSDFVSGDFFRMLGTPAAAGRLLTAADDVPSADPVAVLGYDYWQREFAGHPDAIGRVLRIAGATFTIVGVTPRGFTGLYPGELVADPEHGAPYVFLPVAQAPLVRARSRYASAAENLDDDWLVLAGRRRAGVSSAAIEAQANAATARIAAAWPREREAMRAFARTPLTASSSEIVAVVAFVMAVPALILLVACANLANQLLARGIQRSGEIAVRLSLGASRWRLVRQLLVESSLLALLGGVTGVVFARLITDAMGAFVLVLPFRIPIDARVLAFAVALALGTALVFGLLPALRSTRLDVAHAIKDGGSNAGYRRSRLRSALVVLQVAASVALLALAGVFVRASKRSHTIDVAGNATRLLIASVNLELMAYDSAAGRGFQADVMERLRALPGALAVARAEFSPISSMHDQRIVLARHAQGDYDYEKVAPVAGDWFAALGLQPVAGRTFTAAEASGAPTVAVVDALGAQRWWPGQNPIGQTIRIGEDSAGYSVTVIGVVPSMVRPNEFTPEGVIMIPAGTLYEPTTRFYVRTAGDAAALRASVRAAIRAADTRLPVDVATFGDMLDEAADPVTQIAAGVGAMGIIALLLAALGIAAVMAFIVEQRRFEIGVRMALGARSAAVTWTVLRHSLLLTASGIIIGTFVAAGSAIGLRSMLYGLPPIDPLAFSASTGIMLLVALLSCALPARRAAQVDPMIALRSS